jgi:hypothetical protein
MAKIDPVHSSHDYEETDPKYHNNKRLPALPRASAEPSRGEGQGRTPFVRLVRLALGARFRKAVSRAFRARSTETTCSMTYEMFSGFEQES